MKMMRRAVLAIVVGVLSVGGAAAQIKNQQPAEFPPGSYKGKQYVDSKGCVFIRAGIDGDVAWVPRVTRDRKTICGFAPSLTQQAAAAPQPTPAPTKVEQIQIEAPATPAVSTPTTGATVAAPTVQAPAAKPRPTVVRQVARQVAPKPKRIVVAKAPAAPYRPDTRQVETACPNASAVGQRYLRKNGRVAVRCGPQQARIGSYQGGSVAGASSRVVAVDRNAPIAVSPQRRVVPRHVAINRINTTNVKIPHGYKAAWQDDRLNPKRAEQTLAGRGQMLLVWTNTVPRRLIDRSTGKDVTASTPLVYPYIDPVTQARELGEVTIVRRQGNLFKRILRKRQPVISTRSAPKTKVAVTPRVRTKAVPPTQKKSVGNKRYVQIGYFTTKAKAHKAAQHLAGMGMRARIGKVRRSGKSYLTVQAGPFNTSKATQSAVSRLRGIGYSGAVARN